MQKQFFMTLDLISQIGQKTQVPKAKVYKLDFIKIKNLSFRGHYLDPVSEKTKHKMENISK